jgi:hypothetical protein
LVPNMHIAVLLCLVAVVIYVIKNVFKCV